MSLEIQILQHINLFIVFFWLSTAIAPLTPVKNLAHTQKGCERLSVYIYIYIYIYIGWFVNPSWISDLCGTVAGMVMPKGSMSTEGETLQVSVLPYRCSICPPCCVCLGCCAAEFGSSGGTYELPCIHIYIYIYMLIFPWKIMAFKHKVPAPSKLKGADLLTCFNGGSREGDKDKNRLAEWMN